MRQLVLADGDELGPVERDVGRLEHRVGEEHEGPQLLARALALGPDLLICDEPVSALDVSVQAQVLNLLRDLRASLNLTYIFISHNLHHIYPIADRMIVMARGEVVAEHARGEMGMEEIARLIV